MDARTVWSEGMSSAGRVVLGIAGCLALLLGAALAMRPFQTLAVLTVMVAAGLIVIGVGEVVNRAGNPSPRTAVVLAIAWIARRQAGDPDLRRVVAGPGEQGRADPTTMAPNGLRGYAALCGWSLARAHARSGDAVAIAAYLGTGDMFDGAVADFAEAYARQNALDHAAYVDAIRAGRIDAAQQP